MAKRPTPPKGGTAKPPKQPRASTSFAFGANAKKKSRSGGFKNSGG